MSIHSPILDRSRSSYAERNIRRSTSGRVWQNISIKIPFHLLEYIGQIGMLENDFPAVCMAIDTLS